MSSTLQHPGKQKALDLALGIDGKFKKGSDSTIANFSGLDIKSANSSIIPHVEYSSAPTVTTPNAKNGFEHSIDKRDQSTPSDNNGNNITNKISGDRNSNGIINQTGVYSKLHTLKEKLSYMEGIITEKDLEIKKLGLELQEKDQKLAFMENELSKLNHDILETGNMKDKEYHILKEANTNLEIQVNKLTENSEYYKSFINDITLFNIRIGPLINELYSKESGFKELDSILKKYEPSVQRFQTSQDVELREILDSRLKILQDTCKSLSVEYEKDWKDKLESLSNIEQKLSEPNITLQDELSAFKNVLCSRLNETQKEIITLLESNSKFERQRMEWETVKNEKDILISTLKDEKEKEIKKNEILQENLRVLKGDDTARLSIKDIRCPLLDDLTLESLQLDKIDRLNIIESQNLLKKISICLETPLNKLERKITLANLLIRNELVISLDFINHLYFHFFNVDLDFASFTSDAYLQYRNLGKLDKIRHPLEPYLKKLEVLLIERQSHFDSSVR